MAVDAIADVGPAGHFFGAEHTMKRYETAFYTPLISNWDNFGQWMQNGGIDARTRANQVWKQLRDEYVQPPMDEGICEALDAYVARRKEDGGAPMN